MDAGLQVTTPFEEMEKADEQMVLDEIKGRAIDTLVYEVRGATGLSLAGVRETARVMNNKGQARIRISDKEPTIIENDEFFEVRVYGVDEMNGGGNWGIKRQAKKYGNGTANEFAYEQALAKAQRNALRGLIPEWFVKQMIDTWRMEKSNVKTIAQPQQTAQRTVPAKHWALDRANNAQFQAKAESLEMGKEEILSALNVEKSTEYSGTFEQAMQALEEWRASHPKRIKQPTTINVEPEPAAV